MQRQQGSKRKSRKRERKQAHSTQESGPSTAFLAALEDQRERERQRQAAARKPEDALGDAPAAAPSRPPQPLAGFHFDETQRRYFRLTPQTKLKLKQEQEQQEASAREAAVGQARRAQLSSSSSRLCRSSVLRVATSRSWLACVAERERGAAWSTGRLEWRETALRMFTSRTARSALQPLELSFAEPTRRITALDFAATTEGGSCDVGAIALSGGRVDVFHVGHASDLRSGFARRGERCVTLEAQYFSGAFYQVSALRWQAIGDVLGDAPALLCAGVGGAPPEHAGQQGGGTGNVTLFRNGRRQEWHFADPWSLAWSPARAETFAVGFTGPVCAAYVDATVQNGVVRAPRGKVTSDVMAQAFARDGTTVFNGTRSGSTWLWDVRTSRRAHEHQVVAPKVQRRRGSKAAAIIDLHVLSDGFQVVVLKSDGELSLVDTRSFKTVVEFAAGRADTYSPALKCAVDASETMVVAPTATGGGDSEPPAVCSYAITSGRLVCSVAVNPSSSSSGALLQQVHLRKASSSRIGVPAVWAASRSELFASDGDV